MTEKKLMSVHQIWSKKYIYWIKTYKTILKYIQEYKDILKPVIKGNKTGKRYFISQENLNEFIRKFENNELKK